MQTISHNLHYKMEETHLNLGRHILCIPIYWIRGTLWTNFYSDEALQSRTLTNWCRTFPIIYSTKWRKTYFNPDRHILCLPIYWIRGTLRTNFYSDEALQTRILTNWCRPFPIIYSTYSPCLARARCQLCTQPRRLGGAAARLKRHLPTWPAGRSAACSL